MKLHEKEPVVVEAMEMSSEMSNGNNEGIVEKDVLNKFPNVDKHIHGIINRIEKYIFIYFVFNFKQIVYVIYVD